MAAAAEEALEAAQVCAAGAQLRRGRARGVGGVRFNFVVLVDLWGAGWVLSRGARGVVARGATADDAASGHQRPPVGRGVNYGVRRRVPY